MERNLRALALAVAALNIGLGVWAFAAPRSFFETVATFEPYNRHFLHDIGVFQIGLGATLGLAVVWRDALGVALGGYGAAAILHVVSHVVDGGLGGRATDPLALGLLAAVVAGAAVLRWRRTEVAS